MATSLNYDLVILGATGFTGQFVVEEVLRESSGRQDFRMAVAGRSGARLQAGLEAAGKVTGTVVEGVGIEVVDVTDEDKLQALAAKTRVLVSCVGPYRMYGAAVAEACVRGGCDMLDISGEPEYLETVQDRLSARAEKAGVHLVGSCGFDSVPADVGAVHLQDNFPGVLHHIEMVAGHGDGGGTVIHATTLQCAVLGYANRASLKALRAKIMPNKLDLPAHRPPKRGSLWWSEAAQQWCVANLGSDRSVVTRTQHLLLAAGKPPVHFNAYFGMHSLPSALKAMLFGVMFLVMSATEWSRNLLINWPEVFTFGMFSWAGPDRESLKHESFSVCLTGIGTDDQGEGLVTRHCRVRGPDPGYIGTALILVQCALTVLDEKAKLPATGGAFTPGAAFRRTSLVSRLQARGVTFSLHDH